MEILKGQKVTDNIDNIAASADSDTPQVIEQKRIAAIRAIPAKYPNVAAEKSAVMVESLIQAGTEVNQAEVQFMRADRPQGTKMPTSFQATSPVAAEHEGDVVAAAMCLSGGMSEKSVAGFFGEKLTDHVTAAKFRRMGIHEAMRFSLRAAGRDASFMHVDNDLIRAAFHASNQIEASGTSTMSLPGILGNVANKFMMESYASVATAWQTFCGTRVLKDFKAHAYYRLTIKGTIEEVGENGELKSLSAGEDGYSLQGTTKGAIMGISREKIINDDLGVLQDIPRLFGRKCSIELEKAVFRVLLGNANNFFHADNKNLITGSTSALGVEGLNNASKAFREQTDSNGDPIMLNPDRLIVPPALEATANQLFTSTALAGSTTANKLMVSDNPHSGKFKPTVAAFLAESAGIANASNTGFYMFASPADVPAVVVGFLNGVQNPTIEQGATDFGTLGIQFRVVFDYGVNFADHRAAVQSAGA